MNFIEDEILEIEDLGVCEEEVFDVGMEDTPHTFFANDILVHNSAYFSLLPLIELEGIIPENRKDYCIKITNEILEKINSIYKVMSKSFFNVDDNKIKIVGENVCKTAFWIRKKRYALHVIHELDSGKDVDKFKVKGLDIVRSSFPIRFGKFLDEILHMILLKESKESINTKVLDFESNLDKLTILDVAKNTSVKFHTNSKKENRIINLNPKDRQLFGHVKGATAQCKSALFYNDFLKKHGLSKKIEPIFEGSKIKWVYVKNNPYNIDCLAFKSDGTDPKEIMDFIEMYIDKKTLYEKELKGKLESFYGALSWEFPIKTSKSSNMFFEL